MEACNCLKTVYSPVWCLKESRYSSMLVFLPLHLRLFYSPWRFFCSRLVQANFRPCGCLLFLNHFDKLKDVGVWLSHCFLQARMSTFNMCVGRRSRNSSIVGTGTAYSVINWYMCCWSIRGCRLVGSVEPLPVLLAKVGEQMMGGQKAIAAIFCTNKDHWICTHLQAKGTGPCSYIIY